MRDDAGRGLARVSFGVTDSIDSPGYTAQFIALESELLNGF
jgi:hypothetical protein